MPATGAKKNVITQHISEKSTDPEAALVLLHCIPFLTRIKHLLCAGTAGIPGRGTQAGLGEGDKEIHK